MNILDYVRIVTSTVDDGNMSYSYGDKEIVDRNRRRFFMNNGFTYSKTYLLRTDYKELKLLNNVEIVESVPDSFSIVDKTDSLITNNPDLVIALLTADCLQITLYDVQNKILGLIHAGFKWQNAGIIDNTFKVLKNTFNTKPQNVLIHLGNCISPDHYRWDKNIFKNITDDSWIAKTIVKDNHPQRPYVIDLRKAAILNLKDIGVLEKNILDTDIDCYSDKKYFSHARSVYTDERDGRHITLVQIK
jgi:YfiH family protein